MGVDLFRTTINLGKLPYFSGACVDSPDFADLPLREICFHQDHIVDRFPLLYCASRLSDSLEMNLFMEHRYRGKFHPPKKGGNRNLIGGVTVKTLRSVSNSLRSFLAWLEGNDVDWKEVYAVSLSDKAKSWLPPYRYRSHLIERVRANEISRDTANLYISHVRQFYEWAWKTRRIEKIPFQYKNVTIKKKRKDGDFDLLFTSFWDEKGMVIQTSDLAIPKKYKSKNRNLDDGLSPYTPEELTCLFSSAYLQADSRRLWAELALICGLRASEIVDLEEAVVCDPATGTSKVYSVQIVGKFNKSRKIMIPRSLMVTLWAYKNSTDRHKRAGKWDLHYGSEKPRKLFINRSGKPLNEGSLTNIAPTIKADLSEKGVSFNRSFHDLRSTFATSLARFMLEKQLPLGFIQYKLMALMGHANFSTTQKYINFARSITYEEQMQDWVESIFVDVQESLELEAREKVEMESK